MLVVVFLTFLDLFVFVFNVLLVTRVVASWFMTPGTGWTAILHDLTEPVLAPVRRVLPKMPSLDLAPLVTFFLLQGLQILVHNLLNA